MTKVVLTLLAILLLTPMVSLGSPLIVAVIDTGVDRESANLCATGHKSFANNNSDPLQDNHGHGTHIAGIIGQYAGKGDWCILSIKFYNIDATGDQNMRAMVNSIQYAIRMNVSYINISGGGVLPNADEKAYILKALNNGIKVVVAAGNEHTNLGTRCEYFPACYDKRIITVGNLSDPVKYNRLPSSNYGSYVKRWEVGTNVESTLPNHRTGKMSGTSQAAAIATGKLLHEQLLSK